MQLSRLQLSMCEATPVLDISVLPEARRKTVTTLGMQQPSLLLPNLLS